MRRKEYVRAPLHLLPSSVNGVVSPGSPCAQAATWGSVLAAEGLRSVGYKAEGVGRCMGRVSTAGREYSTSRRNPSRKIQQKSCREIQEKIEQEASQHHRDLF